MKKKRSIWIYSLVIMAWIFILSTGCNKKDENNNPGSSSQIPFVTTNVISKISQVAASSGGNITLQGSSSVTVRGVCWSTYKNPTTSCTHTTDGSGTGSFTSNLTGLTANTTYYVRAYATNSSGTGYGNQISFTTSPATVSDIDGNTYHTLTLGSQEWMVENLKTTRYNDGTSIPLVADNTEWNNLNTPACCWWNNDPSASQNIYGAMYNGFAVKNDKLCPSGWHVPSDAEWTIFTDMLGGDYLAGGKMKESGLIHWLSPNTGADNSSGFTALPGGYRYNNGVFCGIGAFSEFWSATEDTSGNVWGRVLANDKTEVGRGTWEKNVGISVRCVKTTSNGSIPTVTTNSVINIMQTTAICGGNVTDQGNSDVTARGVCWSTSQNPTISDSHTTDGWGTGSFTSNLTGLITNTPYFVRAYSTNSFGTAYGNQISFSTQPGGTGTLTDIDGNVYHTVIIGTQEWMVENLKTTKYNDGSSIPLVTNSTVWGSLITAAYCWYDNDISNKDNYGPLYNWYAVNTGKLAPFGWHVPTDADFQILTIFLGGEGVAGAKMKSLGTIGDGTGLWLNRVFQGNNESGFSGNPGGRRNDSYFREIWQDAYFWTCTEAVSGSVYAYNLSITDTWFSQYYMPKEYGVSARCVKD